MKKRRINPGRLVKVFSQETGKMFNKTMAKGLYQRLVERDQKNELTPYERNLWLALGHSLTHPIPLRKDRPPRLVPDFRYYVVAVEPGTDHSVAKDIKRKAIIEGLGRKIPKIVVPREHYFHFENGQKEERVRLLYPGYLILKMKYTPATEGLVNGVRNVHGFLPLPIPLHDPPTEDEIDALSGWAPKALRSEEEARVLLDEQVFKTKPAPVVDTKKPGKKQRVRLSVKIGDSVEIIGGTFQTMTGVLKAVGGTAYEPMLKVDIGLLGHSVPVDVHHTHVRLKA